MTTPDVYEDANPANLASRLKSVLTAGHGERDVHAFLKRYPEIVGTAFGGASPVVYCVPEFQCGNELRWDFLVWAGASDLDHVAVVELKSPDARLYLKDGTPAKELRVALRQIRDSQEWIAHNGAYFRRSLDQVFKDRHKHRIRHDAHEWSRLPFRMRDVHYTFHIIIGRRGKLSEDEQYRRAAEAKHGNIGIATYDRLIDICALCSRLA